MPGTLVGAASCVVCGATARDRVSAGDRCGSCAAPWLPATTADLVQADPGPLTDVVRAPLGRRVLAVLLDLLVPIVLAVVGVVLIWQDRSAEASALLLVGLAVLALVAGSAVLLRTGRSPGRLLLGLRSVDDLTGTPVRAGRIVRQLLSGSPRPRFLTADLRHGRDPSRPRVFDAEADAGHGLDPQPNHRIGRPAADPEHERSAGTARRSLDNPDGPAGGHEDRADGQDDRDGDSSPAPARARRSGREPGPEPGPTSAPGRAVAGGPVAAAAGAGRPSVGVVLESGERYDIQQVLFIGRSPVDPQPGPGRMLLAWPDLSRRVAKTHLMLEWSGTVLWVTDLESSSGTAVATPDGSRVPLAPGVRFATGIGSVISCGGRSIRVVPGA